MECFSGQTFTTCEALMSHKMTGTEYAGNSHFLMKLNSGWYKCVLNLYAVQRSETSYLPMPAAPACHWCPLTDSAVLDCHICNHQVRTGRRGLGSSPLRRISEECEEEFHSRLWQRQREWLPFSLPKSKQKRCWSWLGMGENEILTICSTISFILTFK